MGRALRLYPAFWVALIITTVFSLVHRRGRDGRDSVPEFLANLTIVPKLLDQPLVDGVYWTLLYEIQFYVLVFLLVLFRQGNRLEMLMPAWAILMLYLTMAAPEMTSSAPYLGGYFVWFAGGRDHRVDRRVGMVGIQGRGAPRRLPPDQSLRADSPADRSQDGVFVVLLVMLIPAVRQLRLPGFEDGRCPDVSAVPAACAHRLYAPEIGSRPKRTSGWCTRWSYVRGRPRVRPASGRSRRIRSLDASGPGCSPIPSDASSASCSASSTWCCLPRRWHRPMLLRGRGVTEGVRRRPCPLRPPRPSPLRGQRRPPRVREGAAAPEGS